MLRYSKERDLVLDQFMGGGTTLVEAKLLNRNIVGFDINPSSIDRCIEKVDFDYPNAGHVDIRLGDARKLSSVADNSIDLICTHPPYADIINYSENLEGDLSLLQYAEFLEAMDSVAKECFRVLKPNKYCAILIGDTRKKGCVIPMGFEVMQLFLQAGLTLKETIIKEQHNCRATGYWKTNSVKHNFLLLAHEFLFVFRK